MNKKNYFFQEILVKNPVLVSTIGLCPVVAICTSLKAAFIMSVITIITLIIAGLLTSLLLRRLPQWVRLGLYTLVGMIVVVPSMIIVEKVSPETMLALGIYFPLLAVNPLVVRNCEREAVDPNIVKSLLTSLCAGLGYSAVLLAVGFIRELIGGGAIFGHQFIKTPASAFLMPMGGFIVIAYLGSALRIYFRKIDPKFADELIENSRTNIKGSKKARLAFKGATYADGTAPTPKKARLAKIPRERKIKVPNIEPKPKKVKSLKRRKPEKALEPQKQQLEVMTLEEAEERKAAGLPPVGTTLKTELAPMTKEDPEIKEDPLKEKPQKERVAVPVSTDKTSRFEFVTLDLSADARENGEAERFAAAVAANRAARPQKKRVRRGQERKIKEVPEKEGEEE